VIANHMRWFRRGLLVMCPRHHPLLRADRVKGKRVEAVDFQAMQRVGDRIRVVGSQGAAGYVTVSCKCGTSWSIDIAKVYAIARERRGAVDVRDVC